MQRKKLLVVGILLFLLLGAMFGLVIFLRQRNSQSSKAVLKVNSSPEVTVFLDNQNLGGTPYKGEVEAGEYTLKLVPDDSNFSSWESRITLKSNLLTYVNRDLGASDVLSGGETLELEKISGKNGQISVISTPDGATVSLDSEVKDVTPLVLDDIEPKVYDLLVSKDGFKPRALKIEVTSGYKVLATFNLAASSQGELSASPSADPNASADPDASPESSPKSSPAEKPSPSAKTSSAKSSPPAKPYVEILDTPTGFLNVRDEPSTSGSEILTKVDPGEYFKLLDENDSGWLKIEYKKGEEGWISGQYAKKYE